MKTSAFCKLINRGCYKLTKRIEICILTTAKTCDNSRFQANMHSPPKSTNVKLYVNPHDRCNFVVKLPSKFIQVIEPTEKSFHCDSFERL